ncbi:MAG: hypothetical protein QOK48_3283, partial [Blastocatellia bacterium]|nr:hypothetical protein [Blastocatellia bacterium]
SRWRRKVSRYGAGVPEPGLDFGQLDSRKSKQRINRTGEQPHPVRISRVIYLRSFGRRRPDGMARNIDNERLVVVQFEGKVRLLTGARAPSPAAVDKHNAEISRVHSTKVLFTTREGIGLLHSAR